MPAHYSEVVKKVNMMSGVIRKRTESKIENIIMPSYGCYVCILYTVLVSLP